MLSAGAGLEALDNILEGTVGNAFCAVRPPGHHAEQNKAMGFCLFNNVGVIARYAQDIKNILGLIITNNLAGLTMPRLLPRVRPW